MPSIFWVQKCGTNAVDEFFWQPILTQKLILCWLFFRNKNVVAIVTWNSWNRLHSFDSKKCLLDLIREDLRRRLATKVMDRVGLPYLTTCFPLILHVARCKILFDGRGPLHLFRFGYCMTACMTVVGNFITHLVIDEFGTRNSLIRRASEHNFAELLSEIWTDEISNELEKTLK